MRRRAYSRRVADTAATRIETAINSQNGQRWVVIGTAAVAVGVASFLIIRRLVKKRKEQRAETQTAENLVREVTEKRNIKSTISETTATSLANSLYQAMEGLGTNETLIRDVIFNKVANAADMVLVNKAFGVKEYGSYGAPAYSWLPSTKKTLYQWLCEECSDSLMKQIDAKLAEWGIVI